LFETISGVPGGVGDVDWRWWRRRKYLILKKLKLSSKNIWWK